MSFGLACGSLVTGWFLANAPQSGAVRSDEEAPIGECQKRAELAILELLYANGAADGTPSANEGQTCRRAHPEVSIRGLDESAHAVVRQSGTARIDRFHESSVAKAGNTAAVRSHPEAAVAALDQRVHRAVGKPVCRRVAAHRAR